MKKYLIGTLICLSSFSFAAENSMKVGELDSATHGNDCNAPQVAGCGPCYKLCIEQNKSDRVAKDTGSSSNKKPAKSGKASASKQ
ncbi:MAG: hypothetical protein NDI69_05785 [Bacteriovoracaceae bacterium]|nr:hypothetical protein [Bacteriovoracaceae bacterium]